MVTHCLPVAQAPPAGGHVKMMPVRSCYAASLPILASAPYRTQPTQEDRLKPIAANQFKNRPARWSRCTDAAFGHVFNMLARRGAPCPLLKYFALLLHWGNYDWNLKRHSQRRDADDARFAKRDDRIV